MADHTPEIKSFINKHADLFWYTPANKKENISDELLVETILNYGDKRAVIELIGFMGIGRVAQIFRKATQFDIRTKGNYQELTINYFTYLFAKYV
ncbi:MAG: hypothetical protein WCX31_02635 [Salinivirgaceae bacterium]